MTELPHLHGADFGAFFEGIHGFAPFPWQARLAAHLGEGGAWPEVLDLPTGTGKTAAIDLAVFQLALEAGRPERAAPLRIVYVVDRRTIVDQAHDRAVTIARAIAEGATPVLQAVRARLASYGRDGQPLRTALLRGGIARSDLWARSPDQPLVAVSTVDQVGSRLLFRGYGVSDSMKPVHAGLLGNDALYLLDEVHLSQPFRETLASVHGRYRGWSARPLPTPFCVVEMSATSGASRERTFELDQDDEAHPLLAKRLQASKPTTLIESTARAFQADVEKQVKGLASRPGATVAVVVNRVAAARELRDRLSRSLDGAAVHLLTGRMRPVDRDALERGVLDRIRAGRVRRADEQPVVIVATQCIEAGADFDFDGLVTECASLDALRQRFGRLDRLGECTEGARATVIAQKDTLSDDPVYGEALGETWRWLSRLAAAGPLDFGLRAMTLPVAPEDTPLLAPRPSAPVMLPSHLDAWVQTSPKPTPDPDVALWLHGPRSGPADVQVVWRADLVAGTLARALDDEGARAVCLGAVQALPPVSREAMSVPFAAAKRWLDGRSEPTITDVEGARQDIAQDEWRERDGEARAAIVWRGDRSEIVSASELRPGDTIVVPATYGGIAHGTWSPAATEPVSDVAELAILRQRGRAVLRLHEDIVSRLFGVSWDTNGIAPEDPQSTESLDDRAQVSEWLAQLPDAERSSEAAALLQILRESSDRRSLRVERLPRGPLASAGEYFLISLRRRVDLDGAEVSTEDDQASFTGVAVSLTDHLVGVGQVSGGFAARLGLSGEVADDLVMAARWHDVGKVDPRFQRLLQGGSEFKTLVQSEPLAKSATSLSDWRARRRALERSGYPPGARHEVMSLALMQRAGDELPSRANDWDLVLHLVASHHGRCRPLAPWVPDPSPVEVGWDYEGVRLNASSAHELARLDSGVAERFWRLVERYGWWGLAWLESILRLADHRRSEEEQQLQGGRA